MAGSAQGQALGERLRELKDRSGLSFATLAGRLHVGTSTLHRYCAGEAVPADFATVERFGRQCGAGPPELLELHRCWLLADAHRSRAGVTVPAPPADQPAPPPPPPLAAGPGGSPPSRHRGGLRVAAVAATVGALVAAAGGVWLATGAPGTDADPVAAAPLSWTVRPDVWAHGCDHTYLVDRPAAEVPAPPVEQDAPAWSDALDAVDGGRTIVETTVTGTGSEPVVLQGLFVRVEGRREPLARDGYAMSSGCGGAETPAEYTVDLDARRPLARPDDGADEQRTLPALRFPVRVAADDPAVLRVVASSGDCDCDWFLELAWSQGSRSGTVRLDDAGAPFRTSAVDEDAVHGYDTATRRWQ